MTLKLLGICFLFALLPTLGCSHSAAPQSGIHSDNPDALRILPLGDSITQANSQNKSYRYWLWQLLSREQQAVDFVGSLDSNYEGHPNYPEDFDHNHEGHWGWRADEILAKLPQWLEHYDADISLIHLGTNDCLKGQSAEQTLSELADIVTLLRQDNPDMDIVLSTLGPSTWENTSCLALLNQGLEKLQLQLSTNNSTVLLAHLDQALTPELHLYDGLHPNAEGEKRMAAIWLKAIQQLQNPQ